MVNLARIRDTIILVSAVLYIYDFVTSRGLLSYFAFLGTLSSPVYYVVIAMAFTSFGAYLATFTGVARLRSVADVTALPPLAAGTVFFWYQITLVFRSAELNSAFDVSRLLTVVALELGYVFLSGACLAGIYLVFYARVKGFEMDADI